MDRICEITGVKFCISRAEQEYCKKFEIPLPTRGPWERMRGMTAWRNRWFLDNGKCAGTGKRMFTAIAPERGLTVYDPDYWQSDDWDALQFGRPYDFKKPFFQQFADLLSVVPLPGLAVVRPTMENSDYTNGITGAKNCYLVFSASFNEDCAFSTHLFHGKDLYDTHYANHCELCYGCEGVANCFDLKYSQYCEHCHQSAFLSYCRSCRDCFGCVNMAQKQYCFFNEQLTKEEYTRRIAEFDLGSHKVVEELRRRFAELCAGFPIRAYHGTQNEKSSGNFISNNKNVTNSYFVTTTEDAEWSLYLNKAKSSLFHCMFGNGSELIYNSVTSGDSVYNHRFCAECWASSRDLEYCFYCCYGAHDCFGSISIKRTGYCILNKQYSKAEYLDLVARIKRQMRETGEYGQFFPPQLSPHYYNNSTASNCLPLQREQAVKWGYLWRDEPPPPHGTAVSPPDHIDDFTDGMLEGQFACNITGKPFKLTKQEIAYYRRNRIPPPQAAPMERIKRSLEFLRLNPLSEGKCPQCSKSFETPYSGSAQPVYCEECFESARQ